MSNTQNSSSMASYTSFFKGDNWSIKGQTGVRELWLEPWYPVSWSSALVCLTLSHTKHYMIREAALLVSALPSGWRSWTTKGRAGVRKSGHNGSQPCKRFQNSLSISSAHNICIGFTPCPPNHHLIPHQTTRTNAGSHSLNFPEATSSRKAKGKQGGWTLSAQFLLGIWPKFLLFPPDCL